jgi:hypothetical protein
MRENLEIELMRRTNDQTQYFAVWVRSQNQPHRLLGTIVERGFNEAVLIEAAAGAVAEEVCEKFEDDKLDPSFVALQARSIYQEFIIKNPRPIPGGDEPLAR